MSPARREQVLYLQTVSRQNRWPSTDAEVDRGRRHPQGLREHCSGEAEVLGAGVARDGWHLRRKASAAAASRAIQAW